MGNLPAAFDGLFLADGLLFALLAPDGRVLRLGEACARLAPEATGRSFVDLFALPPGTPPPDWLAGPRPHESLWDEGRVCIEWRYHRVPGGWLALGSDATERRRRETELRQALRLESIGRMAAGVTHDFNNLLTVIGGHADLLAERTPPGHPDRDALLEIRRACGSAALLTRRLLAFARRQPLDPEPVDLEALLAQMETFLPRVLGASIRVEVSGPGRPVWVHADPGQLDQVLLNLALNARDAMPRGGTLSLRLSEEAPAGREGDWARLVVRDDGHGMDAATCSRLFEPFFTTKGPGEGTGLGLASVHGIILQHGGTIRVESEPGRGTAFEIQLPRREPAAPLAPRDEEGPPPGGRETILLVEDAPAVRALVANTLRSHGYRVLEASQGEEALKAGWRHPDPIDLLLADIRMPSLDGRELARLMSASRPGLKVLLATAHPDPDPGTSDALPADIPVLAKPFTPADLLRKVRQVLDRER